MNLGKQLGLCLVGFVLEVARQIEFVRTFTADDFRQPIILRHLRMRNNQTQLTKSKSARLIGEG